MELNDQALKRAVGRRYDHHTKTTYHLDDNPPPVDNAPLIERLESVYEIEDLEQYIIDKNCYFNNELPKIKEWYDNFAVIG